MCEKLDKLGAEPGSEKENEIKVRDSADHDGQHICSEPLCKTIPQCVECGNVGHRIPMILGKSICLSCMDAESATKELAIQMEQSFNHHCETASTVRNSPFGQAAITQPSLPAIHPVPVRQHWTIGLPAQGIPFDSHCRVQGHSSARKQAPKTKNISIMLESLSYSTGSRAQKSVILPNPGSFLPATSSFRPEKPFVKAISEMFESHWRSKWVSATGYHLKLKCVVFSSAHSKSMLTSQTQFHQTRFSGNPVLGTCPWCYKNWCSCGHLAATG